MSNIFFIGDTHFGHRNMVNFVRDDGTPLRPFNTMEDGDEAIIERWNSVVTESDKVYHLGDVALSRAGLELVKRLNGKKILIRGNHDTFEIKKYCELFYDVRGCHYFENYILTHAPIHPLSMSRWKGNIHGHMHYRKISGEDGSPDSRYINVSVECINYTPIEYSEI